MSRLLCRRGLLGVAIITLLVASTAAAVSHDEVPTGRQVVAKRADAPRLTATEQSSSSTIAAPATTTTASDLVPEPATTTTATTAPTGPLVVPVAANDPDGLADQIIAAETAIRDRATPADALAEAALLQQITYRKLGDHPEWDQAVLDAVPDVMKLSVVKNAQARREFRGMHTKLQENMPPWRIVKPATAEDLLAFYRDAEAEFGIAWQYLAAVNLVETGMGRIRGTSVAGAQGPMQFMPATWDAFGEGDVNDPADAIRGAARYLNHNGGHQGNIAGALWNYNNHNNYVRAVMAYADVMFDEPQMFFGFYNWQVLYLTVRGDIVLFPGYEETERVNVDEYLARS